MMTMGNEFAAGIVAAALSRRVTHRCSEYFWLAG